MISSVRFRQVGVVALTGIVVTALVPGQVHHNEVIRFGTIDLVQTQTNPTTGYKLEMPGAQPTGYMATSTVGVPAGTLTWIWYPSQQNTRFEDRYVTGHMVGIRPSTATPSSAYSIVHPGQAGAGVPIYIPKFSIFEPKVRIPGGTTPPFGPGYDPDFSKPPLLTYNTLHTPLVQPAQADLPIVWTVTYNTKFKVSSNEMVLGFEWEGGEHASKPLSQSLPTGYSEAMFAPSHWGWASPGPTRTITRFDPSKILPPTSMNAYSSPMGGYFENQASVCFHSDWGELRDPQLGSTVYPSYNVGSGLSDLASTPGKLAWDVYAHPSNQGQRALPLLNLRLAPYALPTQLLGRTLEVDPLDISLAVMWGHPLTDGTIGSSGLFLPSSRLSVPALGVASLGIWVGLEYALVDVGNGSVSDTTQAYWFYIEK